MTQAATQSAISCPQCGLLVEQSTLVCPRCGALVHRQELERLAQEATRLEPVHPLMAAAEWRKCLTYLPPESPQSQWILARVHSLSAATSPSNGTPPTLNYQPRSLLGDETWQSVLLKTGGSMLFSIFLYSSMGGWQFAVGLVLLIFIHEMGHVIANWHYGVKQSAPIFLGIFGAVIFLKGNLRNAWEEAVVGIAGPLLGTVGALSCYVLYLHTGNPLAGQLAFFGLFINLFNLLPITPLDGGRTAAAITPFLWGLGLAGLALFELRQIQRGGIDFWWLLILFYIMSQAWPRVRHAILEGGWRDPYFKVGWKRRLIMCVIYGGLAALLMSCMYTLSHGSNFAI